VDAGSAERAFVTPTIDIALPPAAAEIASGLERRGPPLPHALKDLDGRV